MNEPRIQAPRRPLTEHESALLLLLTHHVGQRQAIQAAALAAATGLTERHVRAVVKHLVERHGVAVGSSPRQPYAGFWLIQSAEELWRTRNSLLRRALSILRRVKIYDRAAWVEVLLGQLEWQLHEEETTHGEAQQGTAATPAASEEHGSLGDRPLRS